MSEITFNILKIVVSMAAALITVYTIPYLKTVGNSEEYATLQGMIDVAVHAAEQTINDGGAVKKTEVMRFMTEWLNERNMRLSQEQLSQLIEAAVFSMNQEFKPKD